MKKNYLPRPQRCYAKAFNESGFAGGVFDLGPRAKGMYRVVCKLRAHTGEIFVLLFTFLLILCHLPCLV